MIQTLDTFPSQVVAVLCSGLVTKSEYESVLIPAVRRALEMHPSVRLYYETAADFRLSLPAAWEDLKLGIEHFRQWERIAVVTDVDWIVHAIHAFRFLLPRPVKVFPRSQAELARAWIVTEDAC
jgi:SpoIIAA-like